MTLPTDAVLLQTLWMNRTPLCREWSWPRQCPLLESIWITQDQSTRFHHPGGNPSFDPLGKLQEAAPLKAEPPFELHLPPRAPQLMDVILEGNQARRVTLPQEAAALRTLVVRNMPQLEKMEVPHQAPLLKTVWVHQTQLDSLVLSNAQGLKRVKLHEHPRLLRATLPPKAPVLETVVVIQNRVLQEIIMPTTAEKLRADRVILDGNPLLELVVVSCLAHKAASAIPVTAPEPRDEPRHAPFHDSIRPVKPETASVDAGAVNTVAKATNASPASPVHAPARADHENQTRTEVPPFVEAGVLNVAEENASGVGSVREPVREPMWPEERGCHMKIRLLEWNTAKSRRQSTPPRPSTRKKRLHWIASTVDASLRERRAATTNTRALAALTATSECRARRGMP